MLIVLLMYILEWYFMKQFFPLPDKNPTVVVSKPVYPRWYFRKRFWTVPRKVVYAAPTVTVDSQSSPSDIVGGLYANSVGDGGTVAVGKVYTSGSLFDDIFNVR